MARFFPHPSGGAGAGGHLSIIRKGRTLFALLLQPSAAGSGGRSASRLQPNGGSGAAIQCHSSRAPPGRHGQVRAPGRLCACARAPGLAPTSLLRQGCLLAEGWVVGGAKQGGALRGSEGHRRRPLHVSSVDDLRMAVKEIICDSETERQEYEEAVIAITVEQSLKRYCQRIRRPDFWGGESEFLVLSRLCRQPIIIYIPEREYHGRGNGFIPIAEYGLEFTKNTKQWKKKTPVRLLYSGRNHYDLLV